MRLGIMQPYFFPYIGYFQLINAVDKFVIFDDVNYIKKGWINRNRICLNEQEYTFTIPLEKASQNKLINEIYLSPDSKWVGKLLKTIETAYKKAPMFKLAYPLIESIFSFKERNLAIYIAQSIKQLSGYLEIRTTVVPSSVPYGTKALKGQEKILEICRKEKAEAYINPIGGMEIYRKEAFKNQNIKLSFIKSKPIIYKQFGSVFSPYLSIIDLMMFNEKDKISGFLNDYELI